ncbi:MAG: nucleoside diphosphate kinase regulator [Colwellia polaris]|jgi:regulator of nucleoside diphosphate kinase|uniref:nucleoside diphosphate kinase regulator n=1 Tax=Colwellia polaris TaxID=326537 RepID=UPI000A1755F4|nr:nucleoside diphosphate kinase regulator [Colwellia polaris]|tara:strand:- start:3063 stop:3440 length:378 start_codon:yes stop_codon:yes gene_type:complete
MIKPKIIVSNEDYDGIQAMLEKEDFMPSHDLLIDELDRAKIVPKNKLPINVVRMNSTVTFTMQSTHKTFSLTLVYPRDVKESGTLSILTPVGSALIGLSIGQEIEWPLDKNKSTVVHIDTVEYKE